MFFLLSTDFCRAGPLTHLPTTTSATLDFVVCFAVGETDLRGLDLDQLIIFSNRSVDVYPDEDLKPPVGQGLNKPARITLRDIFPGKNANAEQVEEKLRRYTANQDVRLSFFLRVKSC